MAQVICDEYHECAGCKWKYADKYDDIDEEYRHCTHLIEVAEVKHGYWIDTTAYCGEFTCSICKEMCVTNKYKYCPHCGAEMDEGSEE